MTVDQLLRDLAALGVSLAVDEGQLRVRSPKGVLTPELKDALTQHKAALLQLLVTPSAGAQATTSIARVDRNGRLPLSLAQQRLWVLDQLEGGRAIYHVPACAWLDGALDLAALQHALTQAVERHEALRTTFVVIDGEPVQRIGTAQVALAIDDLSSAPDAEATALNRATDLARIPFDLSTGPLFRAHVFRVAADRHLLSLTLHHAIADAWSMGVLVHELGQLYAAAVLAAPAALPVLEVQYVDFAAWQREQLRGASLDALLAYWRANLAGAPPLIDLPHDRPRPAMQTFTGAIARFTIAPERVMRIRAVGDRRGATLFQTLLAAFQLLLHRYSGQDTIVVGSPVANRLRVEVEPLIGFFVNTLALRADFRRDLTFLDLLEQVQATTVAAYAHQQLPFELLVSDLSPARSLSYNPIFQVMFALQNTRAAQTHMGELVVTPGTVDLGISKFDLYLSLEEQSDGSLHGEWEYASDLFHAATVTRMIGHFGSLIDAIALAPASGITQLPLMAADEVTALAQQWQGVELSWPSDLSITELVSDQAIRTPAAIAIVDGITQLTYAQLDQRSNQVAHHLRAAGVRSETLVGLCVERTCDAIVGLIGILKAGGAYVPLDPAYPKDRVAFMASDAALRVVVAHRSTRHDLPEGATVVLLDADREAIAAQPTAALPPVASGSLAYVIYTSGSTGKPKGIQIEHRNAVSMIAWARSAFSADEVAGMLASTSFCFDLSIFEIFLPLTSGGTVVLAANALALADHPERGRVTLVNTVPSAMAELVRSDSLPSSVRIVNLAGEPLKAALVDKIYAQSSVRDVFDLYGPGETTTYSTWGRRTPGGRESIGRPIANTRLYILDHDRQPVPLGVAGEIYIAGPGVTRGYLNRDALTDERYVTDPISGGRMYRTGDVGRFWLDGDIQYLGRIDHQVKIRGFRIELGEIEHAMADCEGVRDTIVHVVDAGLASPRLVACFTGDASVAAVREQLRGRLPSFMVPAAVIRLDALPLTPNGKVDRSRLPAADTDQDDRPMVAPASDAEADLSRVWCDVLHLDRLSTADNFFEIGGDSILAIQIASKARQAGWAFAPAALFQHQTIAELAAAATPVVSEPAQAADEESAEVALTPVQQWGLAGHPPAPHHFNQWLLLELPPHVATGIIRDAVHAVAAHHSAFRLRFQERDGVWQQWFDRSNTGLPFDEMLVASEAELAVVAASIHGTLNLAKGPIGRAVLARVPGQSPRLLLTIHHLVVDGVSWRILCDDLVSACDSLTRGKQPQLPAKTASYRLWAEASTPAGEPTSPLAAHGVYGEVRVVTGTLDAVATSALLAGAPTAYNARVDEAFAAALALTLAEFTGEPTQTIDLEGHGRDRFAHIDVARTVGWFTHIAPVTLSTATRGWGSLIAGAKAACRTARAGRFATNGAVSLNYLGQLDQALATESGWRLADAGLSCDPARPRRHGLDVVMSLREGRLAWTIEFTEHGHRAAEISRLSQIFQRQLEQLSAHLADPSSGGYAPGDFPDVDLSTVDLDAIRLLGTRFHRNIESILPVSAAQEGILFHSLLASKSDVYVTQLRCELRGALDPVRFRAAWEAVVARHGALRTAFVRDTRQNMLQVTLKQAALPFTELDWRHAGVAVTEPFCERERQQPFDLATAPLMRVTLARTGEATWQFIWTSHHAVLDGWSLGNVLRDLAGFYASLSNGQRAALPALLPYRHYARAAMRQVDGADEAFWQREVSGWCEPLDPGFIRPATTAGARVTSRLTLSDDETRQLQHFARKHRLTLHSILQGAWAIVLARYTDRDDVLFGGVVSGRSGSSVAGIESATGLFIQTVPVRASISDDQPVTSWLESIQQRQVERESHAHVPLVRVRELTPLPRGIDLFETLLVLENYPIDQALHQRLGDLIVDEVRVAERPHYALTLVASGEQRLDVTAVFDNSRVDAGAITPLLARFAHVLSQIARDDGALVGALSVMTPAEHQRVMVDWNATGRPYETGVTLTDLFERQVDLTPDAIAVVFGSHSLTYAELDRRANQLGHVLQAEGVGPETLVGVCLDRSLEMVIALYGILKAGGAYVPIDPSYPRDRRELMVRDSAVSIVLDQARVAGVSGPITAPPRSTGPEHLAYMIYTSGSTGTPKGALNTHAAIVNRLQWMQEAFGLRDDDRVLQKTPFSFDVSVWEFFWPLITGAQLVVAEPGGHLDPAYLVDTIARHGITTLHFVPSMLQVFLEAKDLGRAGAVRRVITSGEALTPEQVRGFHAAFAGELHNLYGPTEAAVDVTWWPCPRDPQITLVPIGRPIANTRMYVLDRRLRPVPAGVAGELYIGGVQVGRGYWQRPDLTAERFLTDPFSATAGARMYRTGDRARFLDDGAIEYLGRLDHQVKIRGVRIELGEVEAVLRSHEGVREAVAIVRTHRGDTQLIAYVVPREGATHAGSAQLRAHLRARLPEVMVPSFIVGIAAIPLSPNGKLDRRALPDPTDAPKTPAPVAAESLTTIERTIADAWRMVLGGEHFGPVDNFFDVGGHSLSAMRVHALLQPAFGPALSLLTLFEYPTVATLARHLAGTTAPAPLARSKRRRQHDGAYDIAVVAMACRVPGATSTDALWDNLVNGREQIVRFSNDELLGAGEDPDRLSDPHYVNAYGALAEADHFDAGFFDIPAAEAEILDPQQRVFLECAWELFERAGYDPRRLTVPVGVYAGAGLNSYALHHLYSRPDVVADRGGFPLLIASDKDFLPTRVSYKLNLKGPSINVQSGCSTSLVAIDLACEALLRGDCDMAVAGGVTIRFPQARGHLYEAGMIFSPDGHTRTFDEHAAGMVTGSGAGAVLLKRLEDAIADGDCVHAVIKASAINNDGAAKIGFTAPSIDGQARVIAEALDRAGVDPRTIGYVEAHGTATPVGDPIEIAALSRAWRPRTADVGFCAIGSVKTNLGHLDAAAGVTGFIKTVLALSHGRIPPNLHFTAPNPALGLEASPFFVNADACAWPATTGPRRAAVSSFGIGGTNAHIILEQAPEPAGSGLSRPHHIVAISARSPRALDAVAARLANALDSQPGIDLADVALTLLDGRAACRIGAPSSATTHARRWHCYEAMQAGR